MANRTCDKPDCERPHVARGLCLYHWKQQYRKSRGREQYTKPCAVCGKTYTTTSDKGRACSLHCAWFTRSDIKHRSTTIRWRQCPICTNWYTHQNHPYPTCPRRACTRLHQLATRPTHGPRRWVGGYCQECGDPYICGWPSDLSQHCTERCHRRAIHARRRARHRNNGPRVYRNRIYRRDQYRCQLCGKKVDRTKEVPHPKAPVLDHIVPLARGGRHEPANVQLAHYSCNALKRDETGPNGDQLLLFG